MKLPTLRRANKNDFEQQYQSLIERLGVTINNGVEVLYEALNGKISLSDNVQCTIKDVDLTMTSTGEPSTDTAFALKASGTVQIVQIGKIENLTNSNTYPTGGVTVTWSQSGSNVQIKHLTGLVATNKYRIRFIAYT